MVGRDTDAINVVGVYQSKVKGTCVSPRHRVDVASSSSESDHG